MAQRARDGRSRVITRRLALAMALAGLIGGFSGASFGAPGQPPLAAVPRAHCGPGSHPETGLQGRVPPADYASHRAEKGYSCNTREVSHFGKTAGLKVFRYADHAGHTCAYYDTTQMFPTDVSTNLGHDGLGVIVLDMSNPARPMKTVTARRPR